MPVQRVPRYSLLLRVRFCSVWKVILKLAYLGFAEEHRKGPPRPRKPKQVRRFAILGLALTQLITPD